MHEVERASSAKTRPSRPRRAKTAGPGGELNARALQHNPAQLERGRLETELGGATDEQAIRKLPALTPRSGDIGATNGRDHVWPMRIARKPHSPPAKNFLREARRLKRHCNEWGVYPEAGQ
jgi:hypothetical protein